uniref:Uncharacterized protein n=1 Tax=Arundo donax TaxID=35708 RepID=A0A0A9HGX3_ARUDO
MAWSTKVFCLTSVSLPLRSQEKQFKGKLTIS